MDLQTRLQQLSEIIEKYQALFSQWDLEAIKGTKISHPWFDKLSAFSYEALADFDANRNYSLLKDAEWLEVNEEINKLSQFEELRFTPNSITPLGKKKKQHELKRLFSLLENDKEKSAVDFGGGVGNLAYFLETELKMNVSVLEKDSQLIETGRKKLSKLGSNVKFVPCHIEKGISIPALKEKDMAIGLHTCGHFATDMFRSCISNDVKKIVNFGCCYSKIKNDDYNLSSTSNKNLNLNQRALSCATLGFGKVPLEFYDYRIKIMEYKYSFYHWLYKNHGILEFCSMSNARRSLYQQSFPKFVEINLKKFFPEFPIPNAQELEDFKNSPENIELNKYFSIYYAVSRYFGKAIEAYILTDRALFIQDSGYNVQIVEAFDSIISPRNKAIVATNN